MTLRWNDKWCSPFTHSERSRMSFNHSIKSQNDCIGEGAGAKIYYLLKCKITFSITFPFLAPSIWEIELLWGFVQNNHSMPILRETCHCSNLSGCTSFIHEIRDFLHKPPFLAKFWWFYIKMTTDAHLLSIQKCREHLTVIGPVLIMTASAKARELEVTMS